ncbi:hypothetical protein PsorP6_004488 [Peronosclerospora sorghi]|uniref:Uncharacterized protein n=1 Tax=Peronosclerospora sorghi TaxID=230839 RepID=A0ACC0VMS6_9STRA|nr:hypothetical protein PsorP6_004488 [Peronosclerospora sorghi]
MELMKKVDKAREESAEEKLSDGMDFMASTICCIDDLPKVSYTSEVHRLFKHKETSRLKAVAIARYGTGVKDFVSKSFRKIAEVPRSHLSVSSGYTLARQLKIICSESRMNKGVFRTGWRTKVDGTLSTSGIMSSRETVAGVPAVELSTKLTNCLIHSCLDLAKHSEDTEDTSMVMSIFCGKGTETLVLHN